MDSTVQESVITADERLFLIDPSNCCHVYMSRTKLIDFLKSVCSVSYKLAESLNKSSPISYMQCKKL